MRLSCSEFENRFHQVLDDRMDPRSDNHLTIHADNCDRCRPMLQAQATINLVLQLQPEIFPAIQFEQPRRRSFKSILLTSLAACAAIIFVVNQVRQGHSSVNSVDQVVSNKVATTLEKETIVVSADTGSAEKSPVRSESLAVTAFASAWDLDRFIPTDFSAQAEWIEPVTTPIRPLTESMNSTFNVLRSAIPGYSKKHVDNSGKTSFQVRRQVDVA